MDLAGTFLLVSVTCVMCSSYASPVVPPCGNNGVLFRNECFYIFSNYHSKWHEAASDCHDKLNATLVTVTDSQMNDFLAGIIQRDVWIGLHDTRQEGDWKWADDTPVNYTNFQDGHDAEPTVPPQLANCVMMQHGSGVWHDRPCKERKPYVCALPRGEPVCSNGGTFFRDRCYWFESSSGGWGTANDNCQKRHGDGVKLPVVVDAELNAFLSRHVHPALWLGLKYHPSQRKWLWVDGRSLDEASYTHWNDDEDINNPSMDQLCVKLKYDGSWTRQTCSEYVWYVCTMQPCYDYDGPPFNIGSGAGDMDGELDRDEPCLDFGSLPICTCVAGALCRPTGECRCQKLFPEMKCNKDDLKVIIPAPSPRIFPGVTITMHCQVNLPPSDVTVTWHKVSGSEVLPAERSSIVERPEEGQYNLTIRDAQIGDSGSYVCVATTILGEFCEARVDSAYLYVEKPKLDKVPNDVDKPTPDKVAHANPEQKSPEEKALITAVAILGVVTVGLLIVVLVVVKKMSSLQNCRPSNTSINEPGN